MPIICACDPGSIKSGYAVFDTDGPYYNEENKGLIVYGLDKFKPKLHVIDRLTEFENIWKKRFAEEQIFIDAQYFVIERQFSSSNGADKVLAVTSFLVRRCAHQADKKIIEISAPTVKRIVAGHGGAKKDRVRAKVEERFGVKFATDDVSDAVALGLAAIEEIGP